MARVDGLQLHLRTMLVKRPRLIILQLFGGMKLLYSLVGLSIVGKDCSSVRNLKVFGHNYVYRFLVCGY